MKATIVPIAWRYYCNIQRPSTPKPKGPIFGPNWNRSLNLSNARSTQQQPGAMPVTCVPQQIPAMGTRFVQKNDKLDRMTYAPPC